MIFCIPASYYSIFNYNVMIIFMLSVLFTLSIEVIFRNQQISGQLSLTSYFISSQHKVCLNGNSVVEGTSSFPLVKQYY